MSDVRSLAILLCGYEVIRKSACVRGGPRHIVLAVPICAYLLETARGPVLVDTGLNPSRLQDPAAAHATFCNDAFPLPPVVLEEHRLLPQLASLGVAPEDVRTILLTHAHTDHVGHLTAFPNAEILVQRREHAAAFAGKPPYLKCRDDIVAPGLKWHLLDGDFALMDGLDLISTPGHTVGHQSVVVRLPSGATKILVGDAGDLMENFTSEIIGGAADETAMLESIRRLNALAAETGGELVVLHDPDQVQAARLAPDRYT